MPVHARARRALPLLAFLIVGGAAACMDTVEPTPVRPPWNVLDTEVTIDRVNVRPGLDTAAIGYTFTNRSNAAVSLSGDDGCPRWAAGAVYGNAIYLLSPVCGLDGFTADSVKQQWSVPANGSTTVTVPFTGVASIGRASACALTGAPTLVGLTIDGQEIAVIPTIAGGTVPAGTNTVVLESDGMPTCPKP